METVLHIKNAVVGGLAAAGSVLVNLLGGWDVTLQVLVGFMAIDYATGWLVAGVFHKSNKSESGALSSKAGFKGLVRKGCVLLLVLLAVLLDRATGYGFIRPAVCLFFIANEGLSILENIGLMGVPFPAFLKNMLEALRQQGDEGKEGTGHGAQGR